MNVLVVLTFVAVAVLVAALAVYLVWIIVILRSVRHTAGLIVFGVRAIADQVAPAGPIVDDINADLIGVRDALRGLLERHGEPAEAKDEQEAPDIVGPR